MLFLFSQLSTIPFVWSHSLLQQEALEFVLLLGYLNLYYSLISCRFVVPFVIVFFGLTHMSGHIPDLYTRPLYPRFGFVCLLVGCLTSQQQASVSQGRICSDKFTCCHTEIEVADQTFYITESQYTDTGPTSPSADPITPGAWQGSHWNANFEVTGMTRPRKNPVASGNRTRDLPLSRRTP